MDLPGSPWLAFVMLALVAVCLVLGYRLLMGRDFKIGSFDLFGFFQLKDVVVPAINGGSNEPGEKPEKQPPAPEPEPSTGRGHLLNDIDETKIRLIFDKLQQMDDDLARLLSAPNFANLEGNELAVALSRYLLGRAHELFNSVLWPSADVVTSMKMISPKHDNKLDCYYAETAPRPDRPEMIPKDGTFSGEVFETKEPQFIPDVSAAVKHRQNYPHDIILQWPA